MSNQTKTDAATPRPWKKFLGSRNWMIEGLAKPPSAIRGNRVIIAEVYETSTMLHEPEHADADAALIVRAVNLLETYEAVATLAENISMVIQKFGSVSMEHHIAASKLNEALANLAKLKEGLK